MKETTKKKTMPIIIGENNLPSNIPNLNHKILRGVKICELIKPSIKNIIDITIDQILKLSWLIKGYRPTIKKNTKKTIPKLLFEPTLILLI